MVWRGIKRLVHFAGLASLILAVEAAAPFALASANSSADRDGELGRATYTNCAPCHGDAGQGGFASPFASNGTLKNTKYVITHVLAGSANMPPFEDQLSPKEIAAVINLVRNNWGNRSGTISAADVRKVEGNLEDATGPRAGLNAKPPAQ